MGWHLRYGDYFWEHHSILRTNQFSWLLPDYIWTNHSWGYDLIVSLIYQLGSFPLLSIFGSLLIALSVYLMLPPRSNFIIGLITVLPFIFFNSQLLNTGLKSSYLSLFFFSLLYRQMNLFKKNPQWFHGLSIIVTFLLWSNLHGQFIFGLIVLGLSAVLEKNLKLFTVTVTSFLATLINPWGFSLYQTSFAHLTAPTLKYIYEWMPWELNSSRFILFGLYLFFFWFTYARKKTSIVRSSIVILLVLTLFSLKSRRVIPFTLLYLIPLTYTYSQKHFRQSSKFLVLLPLILYIVIKRPIFSQSWQTYCASSIACSESLITYLNQTALQGKIFNSYREGGHLIYRYPNLKVFIDGRMTVWQDSNGNYPFLDYQNVIQASPPALMWLYQNQIDYVIIQPQYPLSRLLDQASWPLLFTDNSIRVYRNPTRTINPDIL